MRAVLDNLIAFGYVLGYLVFIGVGGTLVILVGGTALLVFQEVYFTAVGVLGYCLWHGWPWLLGAGIITLLRTRKFDSVIKGWIKLLVFLGSFFAVWWILSKLCPKNFEWISTIVMLVVSGFMQEKHRKPS